MIVLDTNVLSEAMKPTPDPAVARWMVRERGRGLFTTAVSEAEIIYGITILPDGRRKRELEIAAQGIFALFAGRIFPFDSCRGAGVRADCCGPPSGRPADRGLRCPDCSDHPVAWHDARDEGRAGLRRHGRAAGRSVAALIASEARKSPTRSLDPHPPSSLPPRADFAGAVDDGDGGHVEVGAAHGDGRRHNMYGLGGAEQDGADGDGAGDDLQQIESDVGSIGSNPGMISRLAGPSRREFGKISSRMNGESAASACISAFPASRSCAQPLRYASACRLSSPTMACPDDPNDECEMNPTLGSMPEAAHLLGRRSSSPRRAAPPSGIVGDVGIRAAVRKKVRRVGENHVKYAVRIAGDQRVENFQAVALIEPDPVPIIAENILQRIGRGGFCSSAGERVLSRGQGGNAGVFSR